MKVFAETPRLILREIDIQDAKGILLLDSDPEVHLYLPDNVKHTIEEAKEDIRNIKKQYADFGIGRWAVIEKASGAFTGWAGLKWNTGPENHRRDFYDLGYRLIRKYWGRGYASEAAKVSIDYGFNTMNLDEINGIADSRNLASIKILQKVGMKFIETFTEDNHLLHWYSIKKADF
jgi:[ribosomal protein S5]-alanine N-acetyltransferase